jgi:hypothetical protein
MQLNEENSYLCEYCGGKGRIPFHLLSISAKPPQNTWEEKSSSLTKQEWLSQRRRVDVSKWVEAVGNHVDLLEPFLQLVARVEYLESKLYDLLHNNKE